MPELLMTSADSAASDRLEVFDTAAHDLRNPLTVILSLTDLLLHEQTLDSEETRQFIEAIRTSADEMHRLLDDLQEIARIEARQHTVSRSHVPIAALVDEAIADAGLAGRAGVEIDAGLDWWPLAHNRMRRALCLLLADAATRTGTGVSVTVTSAGADLLIEICDDGVALAPEALEELSASLRRGRRRKGEIAVGTGLGPALAARIVEAHGGSVTAAALGTRGTVLRVRLPRG
ncbi:MAG TPA: HAMP domain-containing sensor histidine kinase [Candidatus Kapabacteria bacterium]|nr:HAMP domain-containing sensor histidine kinase [Candidatus Kapabacteria bacterium]